MSSKLKNNVSQKSQAYSKQLEHVTVTEQRITGGSFREFGIGDRGLNLLVTVRRLPDLGCLR